MKPCKADENEHFHNKFIGMMAIVYAKSVTFARNIEKMRRPPFGMFVPPGWNHAPCESLWDALTPVP